MNRKSYKWGWVDGEIVELRGIEIELTSPILLGVGVFATVGVFSGRPLFLEQHWRRLVLNCGRLRLEAPAFQRFCSGIEEVLDACERPERCRAKVFVTSAVSMADYLDVEQDEMRTRVRIAAYPSDPPFGQVKVGMSPYSLNESGALVGVKSFSYAENFLALHWARREGYDEAIMLNNSGHLAEATMANLFFKWSGTWQTPALTTGCLAGVTREQVLRIFGEMGFPVKEVSVGWEQLMGADAAFLTSSIKLVQPITSIKGTGIRSVEVPEVREIQKQLQELL